jgi:glutamate---cysteine ligase / carboxylate-amine ligase
MAGTQEEERQTLDERLEPVETPQWTGSEPLTVEHVRRVFDERSAYTIGLEEELMLLDPDTLELSPSVDFALELLGPDERFGHELREGQIEIRTQVCGNAVAAGICLAEARLRLSDRLAGRLVIASAGTHPFSESWGSVTAGDRYRELAEEYAHAAEGNLPSGLHVHVAVPGADRALAVLNAARSFLPEITALAANSPFVEGGDSQLASSRGKFTLAVHRAGVPPAFESWERFVDFVEWGRRGGLLAGASHLWWDLRPHPRFGTLELRSADAQTRVDDAVGVAAVFQALVVWLAGRYEAGEDLPVHETCRIAENVWRASRYGTRGWMVDEETGERVETRTRVSRMLQELEPMAHRLGTGWALLTAHTLLADNGADRQRYVAERDGLSELVRWLAEETAASAREYLEQRG